MTIDVGCTSKTLEEDIVLLCNTCVSWLLLKSKIFVVM